MDSKHLAQGPILESDWVQSLAGSRVWLSLLLPGVLGCFFIFKQRSVNSCLWAWGEHQGFRASWRWEQHTQDSAPPPVYHSAAQRATLVVLTITHFKLFLFLVKYLIFYP